MMGRDDAKILQGRNFINRWCETFHIQTLRKMEDILTLIIIKEQW